MRKDNRRITLLSDGNIRFGNKIYDFETVFTRFVHNYWNILIISDIYDDLNISFNKFKEKFRDLHAKNSYENFYRIIQQSFKYSVLYYTCICIGGVYGNLCNME